VLRNLNDFECSSIGGGRVLHAELLCHGLSNGDFTKDEPFLFVFKRDLAHVAVPFALDVDRFSVGYLYRKVECVLFFEFYIWGEGDDHSFGFVLLDEVFHGINTVLTEFGDTELELGSRISMICNIQHFCRIHLMVVFRKHKIHMPFLKFQFNRNHCCRNLELELMLLVDPVVNSAFKIALYTTAEDDVKCTRGGGWDNPWSLVRML
jgi:hypothetical protein